MNTETFKRIAVEALQEVLEKEQAREEYAWMSWPQKNLDPNVVVLDLSAMLGEGPEDNRVGLGKVCIPNHLSNAEGKREIERQLDELLPHYRYL